MTTTNREAWLEERRKGIGASDVPAIVGLSPWATPMSVWLDKVGLAGADEMTENQEWGLLLENVIRDKFQTDTGLYVINEQQAFTHPENSHHKSTPDGTVVESPNSDPADALGLVDYKTTGDEPWDAIPDYYQVQGQWQMWTTGMDRVWFAVLHMGRGRRFRIYELGRDDAVIAQLVRMVDRFWFDHVATEEPPPVDGTPATDQALRAMFPEHKPDTSVEVPGELVERWHDAKAAMKEAEHDLALVQQELELRMGDAEIATVDGEPVFTWKAQPDTRIDAKALRAAHPRAAARFEKTTTKRVLRPKGKR